MSTPKERGILFSGPMVRALLAGKKTQTRRAVKPQPTLDPERDQWSWETRRGVARWTGDRPQSAALIFGFHEQCPYGQRGDRLWVRETTRVSAGKSGEVLYAAELSDYDRREKGPWTPSLLMPRSRCRITLDVTEVRVERAQAISDADVEAEGVDAEAVRALWDAATNRQREAAGIRELVRPDLHRPLELWRFAWTLINGRASWDANPWVWVVSFRVTPSLDNRRDGKAV